METRRAETACRLCAQHDSAPGRPKTCFQAGIQKTVCENGKKRTAETEATRQTEKQSYFPKILPDQNPDTALINVRQ
jgi:hypothetical protein